MAAVGLAMAGWREYGRLRRRAAGYQNQAVVNESGRRFAEGLARRPWRPAGLRAAAEVAAAEQAAERDRFREAAAHPWRDEPPAVSAKMDRLFKESRRPLPVDDDWFPELRDLVTKPGKF